MFILNVILVFHFKDHNDSGDKFTVKYKDIVYAVFALIWLWSLYIQFFEYRKGLPHAWYCHQMFWTMSFISQTIILILLNTTYSEFFDHGVGSSENEVQV